MVQSYSKHACGAPSRDRSTLVWVVGVVFLVLGLVSFAFRVMARFFLGTHTWGPDDWVMLLAVVCRLYAYGLNCKLTFVNRL